MRVAGTIGSIILGGVIALLLGIPQSARAVWLPFAGRIVSAVSVTPPIVCSGGVGPVYIRPNGFMPPGPYGTTPATITYLNYNPLTPGNVVVGLYSSIPLPICFLTPPPPAFPTPVPAFPIIFWGTSLVPSP